MLSHLACTTYQISTANTQQEEVSGDFFTYLPTPSPALYLMTGVTALPSSVTQVTWNKKAEQKKQVRKSCQQGQSAACRCCFLAMIYQQRWPGLRKAEHIARPNPPSSLLRASWCPLRGLGLVTYGPWHVRGSHHYDVATNYVRLSPPHPPSTNGM